MTPNDFTRKFAATIEWWRNRDALEMCSHGDQPNCHMCLAQLLTNALIDELKQPSGEPVLLGVRWTPTMSITINEPVPNECPECGVGYLSESEAKGCAQRDKADMAWR